jgi:signal transduction histidine kinase
MRHLDLLFIRSAFLFILFFSKESVAYASLSPDQSPAITSQGVAGATDSLKIVSNFIQEKKYQEALEIALDILEKARLKNNEELVFQSNNIIAQIFYKSNNYERALEYYKRNLLFTTDFVDSVKKATLFNDIATVHFQMEELDSSEVYLTKVLVLKKGSDELEKIKAKAYSNLAGIQVVKSQYNLAELNAKKALAIHEKHVDEKAIAVTLNNLGSIYMKQRSYQKAKETFLEAIEIQNHDPKDVNLNLKEALYDNLSFVLYKLKDYNAYSYQEKSYNIRDSIRDAEISGILAEIEGKYNTESIKKEEQLKTAEEKAKRKHTQDINTILILISITLLVGSYVVYRFLKLRQEKLKLEFIQNQLIQQNELEKLQNDSREKILNATIDGKESERKMIAETLHHSVSSLLSSASLHLQASKMTMKEAPPEEIEKAHAIVKEAADKIRNLSHSLVSSVLLKFGLKYALQDMCEKHSNAAINFQCDCEDVKRYSPDFELKINSIIEELINNVIKHSKSNQAEIILKENNNHLEIKINDNGKGFEPKSQSEKSGLGLKQIEARVNKMKGIFNINSSSVYGTQIYISVPIQMFDEPSIN